MTPVRASTMTALSAALALCCALAGALPLSAAPLEPDAIHSGEWTPAHAQELADESSAIIQIYGYRCDSVASIRAWVFSAGFDVVCNDFKYSYELEDQGGTWVARLK